jgi:hypothetical protein
MRYKIEIEVPEGYIPIEYDYIKKGDLYLNDDGEVEEWTHSIKTSVKFIRLEKTFKKGKQ